MGVGGTYYYLLPQLTQERLATEQLRSKDTGLTADVAALGVVKSRLAQEKGQLATEGVDFTQITEVLPVTEEMPNVYLQMENLVSNPQGVQGVAYKVSQPIDRVTADPSVATPVSLNGSNQTLTASIPLTVQAVGKYADLKIFIQRLELNIRPITLTSVTFKAGTKDSTAVPDGMYSLDVQAFIRASKLSAAFAAPKK